MLVVWRVDRAARNKLKWAVAEDRIDTAVFDADPPAVVDADAGTADRRVLPRRFTNPAKLTPQLLNLLPETLIAPDVIHTHLTHLPSAGR